MLLSIHIENIAVIKKLDINFSEGLTVLTGETGAGKSIIIDSINLILGAKADKELIRTGESRATVSALFGELSSESIRLLRDIGADVDEEGKIFVERVISPDSKSYIRINGKSVSLALLRAIGSVLVNIHGQSDTVSITESSIQLDIIDMYAHSEALLNEYKEEYSVLNTLRSRIDDIKNKERERERLIEILEYQIKDIDSLGLYENEEDDLIDKKLKIKNSEKILKNASFAFKALKGSEKGSVSVLLDRTAQALLQLSDVVPSFSDYSDLLSEFRYKIEDIAEEIYAVISDVDSDPTDSLNKIESRLDKISKIKRKYGFSVAEVLAFREKSAAELEELRNAEDILQDLIKEENAAYSKCLKIADELHSLRLSASKEIERSVKETLEFLDMPKVVFYASIAEKITDDGRKELYSTGYDNVEFYISANPGADPQPLSKIASGGELARIMLALKSVIADRDGISTVIFDEIDAGVSGKTARKIGIKMHSISRDIQLICITHSAQIASLADVHLLIKKSAVNGKTESDVVVLDDNGRIDEISRILGGINITEAQRKAAIDMLSEKSIL